ncbi:MAG: NnrU family protein [Methylocystaceae bacterium]|nr:NnrU family protein [Methylocystaceae bacterium]
MSDLLWACCIFILAHIIPSYQPLRERCVSILNERVFMSIYGLISLGLFIWLVRTYLNAPYIELWTMEIWMSHTTLSIMFIVCILLVCSFSQPNPFSLGIGGKGYDPKNPGIVSLCKHPALIAFALWSFSHILPNGDMASVLFFGLMGALSLYGPFSLNQKRRRQLGLENWQRLSKETVSGWPHIGWQRWLSAGLLYIGLLYAHEPVIGIAPVVFP